MSPILFPVPTEVAFDYLVDPIHRPEWQTSLKKVDQISAPLGVGQTWLDVTKPGPRPRMETTELERPYRWTEKGSWKPFRAELSLNFDEAGTGCRVTPTLQLDGRGSARPIAWVLSRVAPYAVRKDLRRAARILAARAG